MSLQKLTESIRIEIGAGQETGMNSEILRLLECVEVLRAELDHISTLNRVGPYESVKGPRMATEVLAKADQIALGDEK
jgi:hypothetical protein